MSGISFHQRLDEAFKRQAIGATLNTRGVKPDPSQFGASAPEESSGMLDDTDEFENRRGACSGYSKDDIKLRDPDGNDVTDQLHAAFQDKMGIWVDHSPNYKAHHDFVDFPGHLSTRPSLLGPECVVWVDAPDDMNFYRAAWYHPGEAKWIDE